jgi:phosphocarrier protein HPr
MCSRKPTRIRHDFVSRRSPARSGRCHRETSPEAFLVVRAAAPGFRSAVAGDRSEPTTSLISSPLSPGRLRRRGGSPTQRKGPRPPACPQRFPDSPLVSCPRPRPIEPLMSHDTTVARRQVEITNTLGLHLRPADKFVKLALHYRAEIRVYYNGNQFNGKSILDLTTLAAECGTRLELEACGPDAAEAVEALASLVSAQFYENEIGDTIQGHPNTEPAR